MMILALMCHHEIGSRSIRATTSLMEPLPPAVASLVLIVSSPAVFLF